MKSLQTLNLKKLIALTKVMYTTIRRYEDQAFNDMSEEREKKTFCHDLSSINCCGLFQLGIVEQAKQNGELRPHQ